ncbi:MAG: hypothetical protein R8K47_06080 [Mariprofundaceae bacterium]
MARMIPPARAAAMLASLALLAGCAVSVGLPMGSVSVGATIPLSVGGDAAPRERKAAPDVVATGGAGPEDDGDGEEE